MNRLVEISNIFNLICQGISDLLFYHIGTFDEINKQHIDNNFTSFASPEGKQFPLVLALFPDASIDFDTTKAQYNFTIIFADLQSYNNDATANTRTHAEIIRDLARIQTNFFKALKAAQKSTQIFMQILQPVLVEPALFAHNDRLVILKAEFSMIVMEDCNTQDIDLSGNVPVETYDLEDPNNPADSV